MTSLTYGILEVQQTSEHNKKKESHRYREQISGHQWGEGRGEGKKTSED